MTTDADGKHSLSANEIEQVSRVAGPAIREGMRKDLEDQTNRQTETIRGMVTHHEESIRQVIDDHEKRELLKFAEGSDRMQKIEHRIGKIEDLVSRGKGVLFILIPLAPFVGGFLVEWIKHLLKW
jgi:hypothetical protein